MMKLQLILFLTGLLLAIAPAAYAQETIERSTVIENYKGAPCYLHFVKAGETVDGLLRTYNISRDELFAANPVLQQGLKVDQVLRIPVKPESVSDKKPQDVVNPKADHGTSYVVKKQETWYGISKQFDLTVEELMNANPGVSSLQEGMTIVVPSKQSPHVDQVKSREENNNVSRDNLVEVVVEQGQTAYSLSKQYGISVEEFYRLNPGSEQGLKADQLIRVPALHADKQQVNREPDHTETLEKPKQTRAVTSGETANSRTKKHAAEPDTCRNALNLEKTYNIAVLLPLQLDEADSILAQGENSSKSAADYKSFDFFQFYGGIKLAADSLEKMGFKARIHVYDADMEGDTLKVKKVLRKAELSRMDLIIGPVFVKSFDVASRFAFKQGISIVNPLSRRERIVEKNPYVFKIQPSEESAGEGLARYITETYPGANLVLIRNDARELSGMYSPFIQGIRQGEKAAGWKIREVIYSKESFPGVTASIDPARKNIIIFFSNNRSLVPNFVSMLNNYGKDKDITLFGMPEWKDMDIETEFLVKLDYHEVNTSFVDYESEPVRQFVRQFRTEFGTEPLTDKYAFLGYDIGWYFFQALMYYGKDFSKCLPAFSVDGLQYDFSFRDGGKGNGFQNNSVRLLSLDNYQWVEDR